VKARIKRFAIVQPVGHRPFKDRAELHYRDNRELTEQLATYCRAKWPMPQKIQIDTHAGHVLVDGVHRANFSIHEHRAPALPGGVT